MNVYLGVVGLGVDLVHIFALFMSPPRIPHRPMAGSIGARLGRHVAFAAGVLGYESLTIRLARKLKKKKNLTGGRFLGLPCGQ